jgi:hypothetical protein
MRRYDDPVHVRRGRVPDAGGDLVEGPEQFVWRERLWIVHAVLAQWVETGPWWRSGGVHAVLGMEEADPGPGSRSATATQAPAAAVVDLVAEREVWRVEASRGRASGLGVLDLVFDWADGSWRLIRCLD